MTGTALPPLSVLDRSRTRSGEDGPAALRATVRAAQRAEELGMRRFWVAEHHAVPGVAGSAPSVLAAAIAGATERIRVGSGGVMLPNHRPLVVAEQFGVLESLFPGRIDLGVGRSVGFTGAVRRALGAEKADADAFEEQLAELLGYFTGANAVHAHPAEGLRVPAFVLATGSGAGVAARLGLPLVIGAFRGEEAMLAAIDGYRAAFRPRAAGGRPYVVVSQSVAVAESAEAARELTLPEAWASAYSRTRGTFPPLLPPAEVRALEPRMTERERTLYEEAAEGWITGTAAAARAGLAGLAARAGADEILLTTSTFDHDARFATYRALAEAPAGS